MKNKIITAEQAVDLIKDGDTITINVSAEEILIAIEQRFIKKGHPRDLTLIGAAFVSDFQEQGCHRLAHEGLLKKVISGHIGVAPRIGNMAYQNKIYAYNIPMGQMARLPRASASGQPGIFSKVGLGTFCDPRLGGGKQNEITREKGEDLVELVEIKGEEMLFYKTHHTDLALIKATVADESGNLTYEKEISYGTALELAMATKRDGGIVIAQVKDIAEKGSLLGKDVVIPHIFVDYIVRATPENSWQTPWLEYEPGVSGEIKSTLTHLQPRPLDIDKVAARRAALELKPGMVTNFGFGVPMYALYLAGLEENLSDLFTAAVEIGIFGGVILLFDVIPFGIQLNPDSIVEISSMFDFIEGGGLDHTFLALAQMDKSGNVNVSRFSPSIIGSGGFIDITYGAKNINFCGTFTAGKMDIEIHPQGLRINKDGEAIKFVNSVEEITFNGKIGIEQGKKVRVITERAVFEMRKDGLTLIEIAPRVDLQKHILEKMEFKPRIAKDLKTMDLRIFNPQPMGLRS